MLSNKNAKHTKVYYREPGGSIGLVGALRKLLISVLPVLLRAWLIVSIFNSPPGAARLGCPMLLGLPIAFRGGLISTPFMLPGLLVGGLVPGPWLDMGERIGDGDLFA